MQRDPLIATKLIAAVTLAGFALISVLDKSVAGNGRFATDLGLFGPAIKDQQWWRLVSYSLVHFGLLHLGSNLLVLWLVGRELEPGTGPVRFAALYVVSVLGGAAGALIATPFGLTGGASGGVFGVAAAATLVLHRRGVRFWDTGFGPLIVINLVIDRLIPGISLAGHIGGMVAGGLAAEGMIRARTLESPVLGYVGAAIVALASVGLALAVVR